MNIRKETEQDIQAITEVTIEAFKTLAISNQTEHLIVNCLREQGALSLSLVAEVENRVIGHIAFSLCTISDGTKDWYCLAPVSVHPDFQRQGIGKALIKKGLEYLKTMGAKGCCVVGHPTYYPQLGFKNYPEFIYEGIPQEAFMTLSFNGVIPKGTVTFHEAFAMDEL